MSLTSETIPAVPAGTTRVARAAFPHGNPSLTLRDTLGRIFADADVAALFPACGQPGLPPWRLALVTILPFRENLADRQAAEAVRARIDWQYLLGLELTDPGFDCSVRSECRDRLLAGSAEDLWLEKLLEQCRGLGLLKARGQQRTDSTHVVAAIRVLSRLELVGETLRAALNELATVAPNWLQELAPVAVVISKECSLAMASSQLIENKRCTYGVFEQKHYMECTTRLSGTATCSCTSLLACLLGGPVPRGAYCRPHAERPSARHEHGQRGESTTR